MRPQYRGAFRCLAPLCAALLSACGAGATGPPAAPPVRSSLSIADFGALRALAFIAQGANGIDVIDEAGTKLVTLNIPASVVALDDFARLYVLTNSGTLARYNVLSATPTATYQPSAGNAPTYVLASGFGSVAAVGAVGTDPSTGLGRWIADVWDAGRTGAPSRTFVFEGNNQATLLAQDGTLYASTMTAAYVPEYLVYRPGQSSPSRTLHETIVPASQQASFAPNYLTLGDDGTLYVTEYSFYLGDPLAGIYIYRPNGTEGYVATVRDAQGPGPEGIALDGSGNIYVANNNAGLDPNTSAEYGDTLHEVTVFTPDGRSTLRRDVGNFDPVELGVARDGTTFVASFVGFSVPSVTGNFLIRAGSTQVTMLDGMVAGSGLSLALYQGPFGGGRAWNVHPATRGPGR